MEDDPLFRRTRQHAEKRLVFSGAKSDKQRLVDIKEFLRLEKEMLLRYHQNRLCTLSFLSSNSLDLDALRLELITNKSDQKIHIMRAFQLAFFS